MELLGLLKEVFGIKLKMLVALGINKMFEKFKIKDKINEKDVGLLEDAWTFLQHAVADESHCMGNYVSTDNEKELKNLEEARKVRTFVADLITKDVNNQGWCRVKHLAGKAMTLQELITRYLSMGNLETAKKLAQEYKKLYIEYLKVLGVSEENISNKSSA